MAVRATTNLRHRLENQFRCYGDGVSQRAVDRTLLREEAVHAPGGFLMRLVGLELQPNMNPADHEHVVFELDLAYRLGDEALIRS